MITVVEVSYVLGFLCLSLIEKVGSSYSATEYVYSDGME